MGGGVKAKIAKLKGDSSLVVISAETRFRDTQLKEPLNSSVVPRPLPRFQCYTQKRKLVK